jgi:hypothetical protein
VQYHEVGHVEWREGRTENISRTGLLIRAEALLNVATPIEIAFQLPIGPAAPLVVCVGTVVRTDPTPDPHGHPALAATITSYRFIRSRSDRGPQPA